MVRHRYHWPDLLLLLVVGWLCPRALAQGNSAFQPDLPCPPLGRWRIGGKLRVTNTVTGFRLTLPETADRGSLSLEGEADLSAAPYLALWITEASPGVKWRLTADDTAGSTAAHLLQPATQDVGLAVYDLPRQTSWQGRKHFRLTLSLLGRGGSVEVSGAGFFMMQCYRLDPKPEYLTEAKQAAQVIPAWDLKGTREIFWPVMTCEGLADLYTATKDPDYIRFSLIPLARLVRNAYFWQSEHEQARAWSLFGGLNSDASGVFYVAPMEQHQTYRALREYYRQAAEVLPPEANLLVSELIRYIPRLSGMPIPRICRPLPCIREKPSGKRTIAMIWRFRWRT